MKNYFGTRSDAFVIMICALVFVALFVPTLIYGVQGGDDVRYHMSWFLSYRDALGTGAFYPRWLPDQMAGMGSPALYFYPPFTTVFFGLVDTVTLHRLAPVHVLGTGAFLMAVLSACSFFTWARTCTTVRVAAIVATCYALAPYHLMIDLHARAALAEFAAYIWVPLIFAGVNRIVAGRGAIWILCLAMAVAGLFFTHLLTAMMVGPAALLYTVFQLVRTGPATTRMRMQTLAILVLAVCCAIGLAAVFLVPAIRLLRFTDVSALYGRQIAASAMTPSFFATSGVSWQTYQFHLKLAFCVGLYLCMWAYLLIELMLASRHRQRRPARGAEALLWAGVAGTCLLFISGQAGFVFAEPSPFRSIQFLWRFLVIVEFATLSFFLTMCASRSPGTYRTRLQGVCALLFAAALAVQLVDLRHTMQSRGGQGGVMQLDTVKFRLSPTEYFPSRTGFPMAEKKVMPRLNKYLGDAPGARVLAGSATIIRAGRKDGRFALELDARGAATIGVAQFYFPGWRAVDQAGHALPVLPATADKIAAFRVEAGRHRVTVSRTLTREEQIGRALSLASLLLLGAVVLWVSRSRGWRRPAPGPGASAPSAASVRVPIPSSE